MQARLEHISWGSVDTCLFVPEDGDGRQKSPGETPYWSRIWPAALALADLLVCHPELVYARRVLELGAGLGLSSLVAARYARELIASDQDPDAVQLLRRSAAYHQLKNLQVRSIDWNDAAVLPDADMLLLCDVNYDPRDFDALHRIIAAFLKKGAAVLISTPDRLAGRDFLLPLMSQVSIREHVSVSQGKNKTEIMIWLLRSASTG